MAALPRALYFRLDKEIGWLYAYTRLDKQFEIGEYPAYSTTINLSANVIVVRDGAYDRGYRFFGFAVDLEKASTDEFNTLIRYLVNDGFDHSTVTALILDMTERLEGEEDDDE